MASTTCPIFRPTLEEFSDFKKYVETHIQSANNVGICKVIPPRGWFERSYDLNQIDIRQIIVPSPIKQVISGCAGVYELDIFDLEPMTIAQLHQLDKSNDSLHHIVTEENADTLPLLSDNEKKFWRSVVS